MFNSSLPTPTLLINTTLFRIPPTMQRQMEIGGEMNKKYLFFPFFFGIFKISSNFEALKTCEYRI